MSLMMSNGPAAATLCRLLGLPKYTVAFTLRAKHGQPITVDVTYYPEDNFTEVVEQAFTLTPLGPRTTRNDEQDTNTGRPD